MAMMPHPERATWLRQVPMDLRGPASSERYDKRGDLDALRGPAPGRALFESMVKRGRTQ